ncbi:dTDP-4-dehydrorhamnose 3,5-epimerase [Luminiphilus syltensis NOR5-1B]|uniref:dTDP-4-dehydrorhamnose 3,5-epimerase n=1 Tax=Luminiphilus syltensis NOR5-1B TaxID=565045 RepID=B8KUL2_9GAMM|nr:dTDP-4-dehydrorhamnose 3,5-epimerase [Luminiphilus syltensis]EED34466.1 dTDP-4-dehydrorhamnose 3,5-epimerase [Luminiphilus syltensis NOR5-1B]
MECETTPLSGVMLLKPRVFGDERGFFLEAWNQRTYADAGIDVHFVQDNHSRSRQGILRGLHFQTEQTQGKLVRVTSGSVFDVVVDLRADSPTCGQWYGATLSASNHEQLWIPPGFAHGFYVLSESADFLYKCSDYYHPESELTLAWNDPSVGIEWPLVNDQPPQLSAKDATGLPIDQVPLFRF